MLRFGSPTTRRPARYGSRERYRLWLLLAAACLVVGAIRFLERPSTQNRIDEFFTSSQPVAAANKKSRPDEPEVLVTSVPEAKTESEAPRQEPAQVSGDEIDLSVVKDNTYFRAEENDAWFKILEELRPQSAAELSTQSTGKVTYAQLLDQPDRYRGKVVTVRGTVMRNEVVDAPENNVGTAKYHRLVIRPEGGGVWPIMVYSLETPRDFPVGDGAREEIEISGVFFKNWSYAWRDGLGLAPVLLTSTFDWKPAIKVVRNKPSFSPSQVAGFLAAAVGLGICAGWFAWLRSRQSIYAKQVDDVVIMIPPHVGEGER